MLNSTGWYLEFKNHLKRRVARLSGGNMLTFFPGYKIIIILYTGENGRLTRSVTDAVLHGPGTKPCIWLNSPLNDASDAVKSTS